MERNVMWFPWDDPGLEHLRLAMDNEKILADGMILRVKDGNSFRAHYKIRCDSAWRVREADISLLDSNSQSIRLRADGKGRWTDDSGNLIPSLDGCIDVDISITAFIRIRFRFAE